MSKPSIAPYFPWKSVKIVAHQPHPEHRGTLIQLEPDQRF